MVETHILQFDKIIDETEEVKTFVVGLKDSGLSHITGQFYMLRLFDENGEAINETRAYSCSSPGTTTDHVEFTIQLVGSFTHKLWERKVGDKVEVKGPFGHFNFTDEMKEDILLLGAGSGVTPLRAILRHITDKKLENNVTLLYTVRKPHLIIYEEEFKKLNEEFPNVNIHITITRLEEGEEWDGLTGRIDDEKIKEFGGDLSKKRIYLCGPVAFGKGMTEILVNNGAEEKAINKEMWG